jgi:hypothetical protein
MRYSMLTRIIVRVFLNVLQRRRLVGASQLTRWRIRIEAQEARLRASSVLLRAYVRAFAGVAQ